MTAHWKASLVAALAVLGLLAAPGSAAARGEDQCTDGGGASAQPNDPDLIEQSRTTFWAASQFLRSRDFLTLAPCRLPSTQIGQEQDFERREECRHFRTWRLQRFNVGRA